MGLDAILSRLTKVRKGGKPNTWTACCPAHADRSPSLAIRAEADGRVLIHCFGGCEVGSILGAMGLEFADLFPEPLTRTSIPGIRAPFSPADALAAIGTEAALVAIAAADIADGRPLSAADASRIAIAAGRIGAAMEVTLGHG